MIRIHLFVSFVLWWIVLVGAGRGLAGASREGGGCSETRAVEPAGASKVRLAVVQMAVGPSLADNAEQIVRRMREAASEGAEIVVFPESALSGVDSSGASLNAALVRIGDAVRECSIAVILGAAEPGEELSTTRQLLIAFDPAGEEVHRYVKLYSDPAQPPPGVFQLHGIRFGPIICADRWIRAVEELPIQAGAQISVELSGNFVEEWVSPLSWYWYVPRAIRNSVWVVFANTASNADSPGHGHSAVIAPDGEVVNYVPDAREAMFITEIDLTRSDHREAHRRASHPGLASFWDFGRKMFDGQRLEAPPWHRVACAKKKLTVAAAKGSGEVEVVRRQIAEAAGKGAEVIAFPARAISPQDLEVVRKAAEEYRVTVVIGAEYQEGDARFNSAFVFGPDGGLVTRYDQLSAEAPFSPGVDPKRMWFEVQGVPAIVTVEGDRNWTEIAELSAVAGARLLVHLEHTEESKPDEAFRRLQCWCNMGSYRTVTVIADVAGGWVWEDLHSRQERRSVVRRTPGFIKPEVEIFSPFSANLLKRSGEGEPLTLAIVEIPGPNDYYTDQIQRFAWMDIWARYGAALIGPTPH